jgi:two-component system, sensor histidine kinase and response regulator
MRQILVMEDDLDLLILIEEALNSAGFKVIVAKDGQEGVDLATKHKPDLIISDIGMPKLTGYEAMDLIRQNPELESIPFIILTGFADPKNQRIGMNRGADDYLSKPFTIEVLLGAINARIQRLIIVERLTEAKLDALRKNIATSLPHEMRTPLVGIIGLVDLLIDSSQTIKPNEVLEYSQDIKLSADRLLSLIQNYITYAELELNKEAIAAEVFLAEKSYLRPSLIQNIGQFIAKKYGRQSDLQLEEIPTVSLTIKEVRLYKILGEVIDNAFKFSKPGTPVKIDGWLEPESPSSQGMGQVVIRISDRGRGFSAEEIKNVGAYIQFERKIYEQQGGGLGLALAKQLAELFKGSLSIASELGKYTEVQVRLPTVE